MRDLTVTALDFALGVDVENFSISGDGTYRLYGEVIPDRVFEDMSTETLRFIYRQYRSDMVAQLDNLRELVERREQSVELG